MVIAPPRASREADDAWARNSGDDLPKYRPPVCCFSLRSTAGGLLG